jgi:2-dehydro-3-deoxygluconokinase
MTAVVPAENCAASRAGLSRSRRAARFTLESARVAAQDAVWIPVARDVLAFGEALLRLQPAGDARLDDAGPLEAHPGGAELNTCYALASLGADAAWFSVLPEGPLGRRVLRHLRGGGVDCSLVRTAPGRLGTYWVEYGRDPRAIEVVYDRRDSTVCRVRREDVPWDAVRSTRLFFVSGITPALSAETRAVALEMAEAARAAGVTVATDLNYRARLWAPAEAAPVLERLARLAGIVITTADDLRALFGLAGDADALAAAARERFACGTIALTLGAEGALCLDGGERRRCATFPSHSRDRIGAGDAFTAGFLHAWLLGRREKALDYGLALAALKHSVPGDTLATTPEEVERVMARGAGGIRR